MTYGQAQYAFGLIATATPEALGTSGTIQVGTSPSTRLYAVNPDIIYSLQMQISDGDTLTLDFATGAVTGSVAGVHQVETFTVVAAAGCTSDGTCNVVVTGAHLTGSPITVPVALTTATHTTADLIRAAIGTALTANAVIASQYTIGGSSADGTLTDIQYRVSDATLNVAIPSGLGITAAPTSADTTAGVGVSAAYRKTGGVWTPVDQEGFTLPAATDLYSVLIRNDSTSDGPVLVDTIDIGAGGTNLAVYPTGGHPWAATAVTFEATAGDTIVNIDIHAGS